MPVMQKRAVVIKQVALQRTAAAIVSQENCLVLSLQAGHADDPDPLKGTLNRKPTIARPSIDQLKKQRLDPIARRPQTMGMP